MSRTTTSRRLAAATVTTSAAVVAAVLTAGAGVSSAHSDAHSAHDRGGAGSKAAGKGLVRGHLIAPLRRALAPYEDVETAMAAGFIPTGPCAESPDGGMGFHYTAPARFREPLEVTRPHILLYGPAADGGLELLGAEYMVFDADQDLSTDDDRPVLLGQPFDGPMPGHEEGMPVHYDLHVWTHKANPAGVFAPWNPRVSC